MSAKSKSQYNLMQAISHGKSSDKKSFIGPSKEVADKFIRETPSKKRSLFAKKKS